MLITFQFPFCDLRSFIDSSTTHKLCVPSWLTPVPDHDFVRSFGAIRRRPLGGLSGWLGESMVCEANRAIRFKSIRPFRYDDDNSLKFKIVFKRLYFDGLAVGKYEIGMAVKGFKQNPILVDQTRNFFKYIFQLPVSLPNPQGDELKCKLSQASSLLSGLYTLSTTSQKAINANVEIPHWWVQHCEPIILVTCNLEKERLHIPFWGKSIRLNNLDEVLTHYVVPLDGKHLRMWLISEFGHSSSLRQLRIYLLRLHAERSCLRQVLRAIASGQLTVSQSSQQSQELQYYLNASIRRINRLNNHSKKRAETDVEEYAQEAEDFIMPGEKEALLKALRTLNVRKNIFRKVEDFVIQQTIVKEQIMGDKYSVGQAGAVGSQSHAHHITFNQIWNQVSNDIDLSKLGDELTWLRNQMKQESTETEHDVAVGEIALAEIAANKGDGPAVMDHLAKAGKWALDVATKIGVTVAASALKSALGL